MRVGGDREFLRQVVDNLVDNAIKYTPQDGRVTVTLSPDGDRLRKYLAKFDLDWSRVNSG